VRLLLDSHFVLWLAVDSSKLNAKEREFLAREDLSFVVSAVSIWELRIKWQSLERKNKAGFGISPIELLKFWRGMNVEFEPLNPDLAVALLRVPLPHKDPFDHLLVLQAQELGIKIFTRDDDILDHPLAISV
jgi:PIN domain nuclease of toxin-antitoxin system